MLQPPIVYHQQHQHPASFIDSRPSSSLHHYSAPYHPHPPPHQHHQQQQHLQRPSSPHRVNMVNRVASSEIETGVWTSTEIPADITFGPFDGEFTLGNGMKDHRATPYMLEVKFVEGRLISGPDAHPTRWMRFVSSARKEHEHNLEAECSVGDSGQANHIVFRTIRAILKGEELLVWYSSKLAEKEGVPVSVNRFKGKDSFTCSRCCSNFRYPNTLKAHMRFRCYTQDSAIVTRHLNNHHENREDPSSVGSAFHRVSSSTSNATDRLHASSSCPLVLRSPKSSPELGRMDDPHARRSTDPICSRSSGASPTATFNNFFSAKIGSGSGSAFRPTGRVINIDATSGEGRLKEKEGFRVVRKDSVKMGTSMGIPISPTTADSKPKIEPETSEERTNIPVSVNFSMDKVLSMPRVGNPRTPGAALAYFHVQKALEKNYGLPTYDPVASHAGGLPVAIRSLHRAAGPLGVDPYTGYPYRFFPPPGFPVARLPPVLPMHRHGEAYNGLAYKFPYPGVLKYSSPEPTAAPPSALLTPPPEMDLNKYATLERNLTSQATRTFPMGDPQFAYTHNANGKSKRGHLCIYCGKLYSRKYGLKIHLRTHTGYKPLKCKVCLRPFGDPSNLNKHIRLHAEGDTPYRCEYCGKVLVRRRDLDRHIRSRHPNECTRKEEEVSATKENDEEQAEDLTLSVDDDDDDDDKIDSAEDDGMDMGDEEGVRQS